MSMCPDCGKEYHSNYDRCFDCHNKHKEKAMNKGVALKTAGVIYQGTDPTPEKVIAMYKALLEEIIK